MNYPKPVLFVFPVILLLSVLNIMAFSDEPFIREGYPNPPKGLSGEEFVVSPGHGINWEGDVWDWERPLCFGEREDHHTAAICNRWLLPYFKNAGAVVYSCRERDEQPHEVIIDLNSINDSSGYNCEWQEFTDGIPYGGTALKSSSGDISCTASIQFSADIPEDGFYSVSIWYPENPDPCDYVEYIIMDGGGNEHIFRINQAKNCSRWNYLDSYYFKAGKQEKILTISGAGTEPGKSILADAVCLGSGMGSSDFGGGVSGRLRWEESSQAWLKYMGAPEYVWNLGFGDHDSLVRFYYTNWQTPGKLFLRIHTNALDGTMASGSYARFWGLTEEDNIRLDGIYSRMLDSVWKNWDKSWTKMSPSSSVTPWSFPSILLELGFHDTFDPDSIYIMDPDFRHIICRGIYEGVADYLTSGTEVVYLPEAPSAPYAVCQDGESVKIGWRPPVFGTAPDGYRIFYSTCPYSFKDNVYVDAAIDSVNINSLESGRIYYFRIRAENEGGISFPTETLAAVIASDSEKILIIGAFDRMDWLVPETDNTHNYVIQHIKAMYGAAPQSGISISIDYASNEAIEHGDIDLKNYFMVDWSLGEEGRKFPKTANLGFSRDEAFTPEEIDAVNTYLENGGMLFLSGSEFASDLFDNASSGERYFLQNKLRCRFINGDAENYKIRGRENTFFDGILLDLDDGSSGTYNVEEPDVIAPGYNAISILEFDSSDKVAGVQYIGDDYRVIAFSFPFETIKGEDLRIKIMERIFNAFTAPPVIVSSNMIIDHILKRILLSDSSKVYADRNSDKCIDVADLLSSIMPEPTPPPTPTPTPTPTATPIPLFFDDFSKNSSSDYIELSGSDTLIMWAYDYSLDTVHEGDVIPAAPRTTDTSKIALRMEVNISYPGNQTSTNVFTKPEFSGNFRVKADVFFRVNGPPPGGGTGGTEYYRMGINHSGTMLLNSVQSGNPDSPVETDGYFFQSTGDANASNDYYFFEGDTRQKDTVCGTWGSGSTSCGANGNNGTDGLFFKSIYTPYESNYPGCSGDKWTTVKFEFIDGIVTVFLEDIPVHTHGHLDPAWPFGRVCLGMEDSFTSIAPAGTSFVLFDNLAVEQIVK
jgi:fibronectin type III domain protein